MNPSKSSVLIPCIGVVFEVVEASVLSCLISSSFERSLTIAECSVHLLILVASFDTSTFVLNQCSAPHLSLVFDEGLFK